MSVVLWFELLFCDFNVLVIVVWMVVIIEVVVFVGLEVVLVILVVLVDLEVVVGGVMVVIVIDVCCWLVRVCSYGFR